MSILLGIEYFKSFAMAYKVECKSDVYPGNQNILMEWKCFVCCHEWEDSPNVIKMRLRRDQGRFCPKCSKQVSIKNQILSGRGRKHLYQRMTWLERLSKVKALKVKGSQQLQKKDAPLYEVLLENNEMSQLQSELGWRKAPRNLKKYKLEEWITLAKNFSSRSHWKNIDPSGYTKARQSKYWGRIQKSMQKFWDKYIGLNGRKYASFPEMFVANILFIAKLNYKSHPILPFKFNGGYMRGDFLALKVYIEVFGKTLSGAIKAIEKGDTYWSDYIERRKHKELKYPSHKLVLCSIEAQVYAEWGATAFFKHIIRKLKKVGIHINIDDILPLVLSSLRERGEDWSVNDFADYLILLKLDFLTHLTKVGETRLYNLALKRKMTKAIRLALSKKLNRQVAARKDIILTALQIKIEIKKLDVQTRREYQDLHKNGKLRVGMPQNPLQDYPGAWDSWPDFLGTKKPTIIKDYNVAKVVVSIYQFRSSGEFEKARKDNLELQQIYALPDHKISGYVGWVSWADFLGR